MSNTCPHCGSKIGPSWDCPGCGAVDATRWPDGVAVMIRAPEPRDYTIDGEPWTGGRRKANTMKRRGNVDGRKP